MSHTPHNEHGRLRMRQALKRISFAALLAVAFVLLLSLLTRRTLPGMQLGWLLPLAILASIAVPRVHQLLSREPSPWLLRLIALCTILSLALLHAAGISRPTEPNSRPQPEPLRQAFYQTTATPTLAATPYLLPLMPAPTSTGEPTASITATQPRSLGSRLSFLPLVAFAQPQTSWTGLTFVSAPRISREKFVAVLSRGTALGPSPAAQHAGELFDIIAGYGLDPAVALAFFAHESQYCNAGVCKEQDTKSWGNQRRAVDPSRAEGSAVTINGNYARYRSWQDGARDWCELILQRYVARGLDTVEKAVPIYAPAYDSNDPQRYIEAVYTLIISWQRSDG